MEDSQRKSDLSHIICRIATFVPSYAIMLGEIAFGVVVGTNLSPKHIMIALAHGVQETGQSDDREIQPPKALAVGSVSEFVLTYLIAKDIPLPFALHPWRGP